MTDHPYTDEDLRAEAARQHATLTEDPDFMGVGERMEDQEVTPGGGVSWNDFSEETYDTAQRSIHDLINGAADVSEWAINLGADGLEPDEHQFTLCTDEKPIIRVHFAFAPELSDAARDAFVQGLGEAAAHGMRLSVNDQ